MRRLALVVATVGYTGFSPVAPGTAGSVVGLALVVFLRWVDSALLEAATMIGLLAVGVWSATIVEKELGKDPGPVVIDEVLGMLITLAFLDVTPLGAFVGFVLFRAFDVLKPYPAAQLEALHGGPGIMMDDVLAGLYGQVTMRLLVGVAPGVFA